MAHRHATEGVYLLGEMPAVTAHRKTGNRKSGSTAAPGKRDPLLSAICHDLRAPLAAVTMGANFVLQTLPEDETGRSRRILEAVLRSCGHMERLVRNFADLSEIESRAVVLRVAEHDACELLAIAAGAITASAAARSIRVEVTKPEAPLVFRCDRDRTLRALGHIIENAVKVAPEGSAIELAVEERGKNVAFRVTDHGPGLSPQLRENLFDREWHGRRADRTGTGFGLAIARGFVDAHGGQIDVESQPDSATVFTIVLPKDGPDAAPAHPRRAARPSSRRRR